MNRAGFFRELPHGDADGPSLVEALDDPLPDDERPAVAEYLQGCPVLIATTAVAADALDPGRQDVSELSVRTDGLTMWSEDLAYYVRTYGVRPPNDLLERAAGGNPPELTDEDLEQIEEQLLGPEPTAE